MCKNMNTYSTLKNPEDVKLVKIKVLNFAVAYVRRFIHTYIYMDGRGTAVPAIRSLSTETTLKMVPRNKFNNQNWSSDQILQLKLVPRTYLAAKIGPPANFGPHME